MSGGSDGRKGGREDGRTEGGLSIFDHQGLLKRWQEGTRGEGSSA